jgi:hypothetical protein
MALKEGLEAWKGDSCATPVSQLTEQDDAHDRQ